MKIYLLFPLMVFFTASRGEAIYYVVPSSNYSLCPGLPCESLQYYLNDSEILNQQESVVMIFLKGNHSVDCLMDTINPVSSQSIKLIGEHPETLVRCLYLNFNNVTELHLKQLRLLEGRLSVITPISTSMYSIVPQVQFISSTVEQFYIDINGIDLVSIMNSSMKHTYLNIEGPNIRTVAVFGCTLHDGTIALRSCRVANIEMKDCTLVNNQAIVYDSSISFSGNSTFTGSLFSAVFSISSTITLEGNVSFINNSAFRGGAIALYSSQLQLMSGANVTFINNSAQGEGGAIYVDPDLSRNLLLWKESIDLPCFYRLLNCSDSASYSIHFVNNSATNGGDDIYGASLKTFCNHLMNSTCHLTVHGITSVSSDPTRVCICDKNGKPQCTNGSYVLINNYQVHSGEELKIPAVVVGGDFGPTIGVVYAYFLSSEQYRVPSLKPSQYHQLISNTKQCTELIYNMYSNYTQGDIIMYLAVTYTETTSVSKLFDYELCVTRNHCSRTIPVFFNISLLSCPPGFTLLGDPAGCECYPELAQIGIECKIIDRKVLFLWKSNLWIDISRIGVAYSKQCPFNYCHRDKKKIELDSDTFDSQCSFNRAGRLCGGCKENYSLAIGSSHCIHCPNNNNLALLILFAAAGFLLVFFISAFNLTVTQGMINGLIFYSNIVWTYHQLFFPPKDSSNAVLKFLKVFIAWVNLDFGIEMCFVNGLTAFWKTWLQFIFPFYIWAIAGLIILATRYSIRLTSLFGSRAVPVLNTLFLLSYMKLLNTVVSALEFSIIVYSDNHTHSTSVLWSVDGSLSYFEFPHVVLFLAGLAVLLFLWLPYTLLLLLMQWLRRLPHCRLLKWMMQFHPAYDAYFAPMKPKQHHLFGVLLLVRGTLLVTFASTFHISQNINLLLLLVLTTTLLLYVTLVQPYKSRAVLLLQSTNLANLNLLSGFFFFTYTQSNRSTLQVVAIGVSAGMAFLQFCAIVLHALIAPRCSIRKAKEQLEDFDTTVRIHDPLIDVEPDNSDSHDIKLQPLLPTY